ncbi:hypothetical protein GCM10010123_21130 [Pilimelia anulata]|uniref:Peptidase S8/S53 domain-containing protein n=1 Tax=Pilimelia anulata TaxID=53371 RepID=A0A8J3B2N1_9ACTN|nr:S8 family serine peptidase [Pilimelia anulata]GGJ91052.1 hypothetical protein GCM10010123_21130 [Pilimelia anulata]
MNAPWPAHPQPPYLAPPPPPTGKAAGIVGIVLVGLWSAAVAAGGQLTGWVVDQFRLATGGALPHWLWTAGALGTALLVGLPALLLAVAARPGWARYTGRLWLAAAGLLAWLGPARLVPPAENERYLLLLALLAGLAALAGRLVDRRVDAPPAPRGALPLGAAAGAVVLLPWLWLGAAGGPLETALAALAALAVGALAAVLLGRGFRAAYPVAGRLRRTLALGPIAGVALLLLGAGTGPAGPHLAVLLVLGAAGFAAAALGGGAAAGALVALAAFGPLAGVDGEEVTLLLLDRDVPYWTLIGTLLAVGAAWLVGAACAALARPTGPGRVTAGIALVATLLAGTAVYAAAGQPGFFGDRLFVVLRDQAAPAAPAAPPGLPGHAARTGAVYAGLVAHAERTQAGLRAYLADRGLRYTPYYLVNAIEVDAGPALRPLLERRSDVARVLFSPRLRPLPAPVPTNRGEDAAPVGVPWNIRLIGADRVWRTGVTGVGITVGTSDSGVDGRHPRLSNTFRGGDDSWYDPWNGSRSPTDRGGHGTHTLGTAVGAGGIGVAPGAGWVGCVNLDRNLGNPARYLDCLQFMLAPFPPGGDPFRDGRPARASHVLTNSWGCPAAEGCDTASLAPAIAAFRAAGVFFAAAAGNEGPGCATIDDPPAPYPDAFTVGAVDAGRAVTSFSSRGPTPAGAVKPDVVAPGADILSAVPGGTYTRNDGTSMATPHVAGVVALVWSANPRLVGDVAGTRELLRRTASRDVRAGVTCGGDPANATGAGLVDAAAAVAAARAG